MKSDKVDIEWIKGQLKNGYIDITSNYPDEKEFNFVKEAIEFYEKYTLMQKRGIMSIEELLEMKVKGFIERYIINLDLSNATKNILKRELRKNFLDEDLIYDLENARKEVKKDE